jgi:hypothetical protein
MMASREESAKYSALAKSPKARSFALLLASDFPWIIVLGVKKIIGLNDLVLGGCSGMG